MSYKYYLFIFTVNFILNEKSAVHSGGLSSVNGKINCKCGWNLEVGFRIVGGQETDANSHPWMVGLFHPIKERVYCGGSLINDRYVLTAAHCLKPIKDKKPLVVLGLQNKLLFEESREGGLMLELENSIVHEKHESIDFYDINDIALLKLKERVKFNKKINPVCLPTNPDEDYKNEIAHVLGWGKLKYKGASATNLRETSLTVLPPEKCKENSVIGKYIRDEMLCALENNTDACQGDSGGPLILEKKPGKAVLIGLVSWGIGCAEPDVPGVYTRISKYLHWIAKNTPDASYCKNR